VALKVWATVVSAHLHGTGPSLGASIARFEFILMVVMKIQVFLDCAPCPLVLTTLLDDPEGGRIMFLRNSDICLAVDTAKHLRSLESSAGSCSANEEIPFVLKKLKCQYRINSNGRPRWPRDLTIVSAAAVLYNYPFLTYIILNYYSKMKI
jgi:hypothetical protein